MCQNKLSQFPPMIMVDAFKETLKGGHSPESIKVKTIRDGRKHGDQYVTESWDNILYFCL